MTLSTWTYMIHATGWSLFGLTLGLWLDNLGLAVARVTPLHPSEDTVPDQHPPPRPRRLRKESVVPVVLVTLALVSALQGIWFQRTNQAQDAEDRRIQQCQQAYANGFADAIYARSAAATVERKALVAWMTTLDKLLTQAPLGGDPAAARQRFAEATTEYLRRLAELERKQQENPFPPAPRDLCQ